MLRAIVKKPAILVLDEPTSSMDAKSEQRFVAKLKEADFDTTLLVITHRTSLLTLVDKVIIMENGQVAGIGSTDQFMKAQTDHGSAAQIVRNANEAKFPNRAGSPQMPTRPSPPPSNAPSKGIPAFKIDTKKIMK